MGPTPLHTAPDQRSKQGDKRKRSLKQELPETMTRYRLQGERFAEERTEKGTTMQESPSSLKSIIDQVSQEKGIDGKVLVEATEQAILMAAKRTFGMNRELEARFNQESGVVDLFQYMTVVEDVEVADRELTVDEAQQYGLEAEVGEELGFQIFYLAEDADAARVQDEEFGDLLDLYQARQGFGRIAAQTAKQVILQRVREAERDRIYEEFKDRKGETITGIVRRFERGSNIVVDIGKDIEAVLPNREQTPRESYRPGDRIVALLKNLDREARGQQLILSRTDDQLLAKLFEMEVPEIYEGIVRIVAAAREPGSRSKIAVASRDSDVDPVGACVGMKGSRVQAVVQELRGEKIDIVPWERDPARFVCNAIAPAEVSRVIVDEARATMELVVPDAKLSLAIGRRGQNVRLASRLTGWKLEIIGESRFKELQEESMEALESISLLDEEQAKTLYRMGFRSVDEVFEASEQELRSIEGFEHIDLEKLRNDAAHAGEKRRHDALVAEAGKPESLSEKEQLRLVRTVTARLAEALEAGGYRSPAQVASEESAEKLAVQSGMSMSLASSIYESAIEFVEKEWPAVLEAKRVLRATLAVKAKTASEAGEASVGEHASEEGFAGGGTAGGAANGESMRGDQASTGEDRSEAAVHSPHVGP